MGEPGNYRALEASRVTESTLPYLEKAVKGTVFDPTTYKTYKEKQEAYLHKTGQKPYTNSGYLHYLIGQAPKNAERLDEQMPMTKAIHGATGAITEAVPKLLPGPLRRLASAGTGAYKATQEAEQREHFERMQKDPAYLAKVLEQARLAKKLEENTHYGVVPYTPLDKAGKAATTVFGIASAAAPLGGLGVMGARGIAKSAARGATQSVAQRLATLYPPPGARSIRAPVPLVGEVKQGTSVRHLIPADVRRALDLATHSEYRPAPPQPGTRYLSQVEVPRTSYFRQQPVGRAAVGFPGFQTRHYSTLGVQVPIKVEISKFQEVIGKLREKLRKLMGKKTTKATERTQIKTTGELTAAETELGQATRLAAANYPYHIDPPETHKLFWDTNIVNPSGKFNILLPYANQLNLILYNPHFPVLRVRDIETAMDIFAKIVDTANKTKKTPSYQFLTNIVKVQLKTILQRIVGLRRDLFTNVVQRNTVTNKVSIDRAVIETRTAANGTKYKVTEKLMEELDTGFKANKTDPSSVTPETKQYLNVLQGYVDEVNQTGVPKMLSEFKSLQDVKHFLKDYGDITLTFDHALDLQVVFKNAELLGTDLKKLPPCLLRPLQDILNKESRMILVANRPNTAKGDIVNDTIYYITKRAHLINEERMLAASGADATHIRRQINELDELWIDPMEALNNVTPSIGKKVVNLFETGKPYRADIIREYGIFSELAQLERYKADALANLNTKRSAIILEQDALKATITAKKKPSLKNIDDQAKLTKKLLKCEDEIRLNSVDLVSHHEQLQALGKPIGECNLYMENITMHNFDRIHGAKFTNLAEEYRSVVHSNIFGKQQIKALGHLAGGDPPENETETEPEPNLLDELIADQIMTAYIYDNPVDRDEPYTVKEMEQIERRYRHLPEAVENALMDKLIASIFKIPVASETSQAPATSTGKARSPSKSPTKTKSHKLQSLKKKYVSYSTKSKKMKLSEGHKTRSYKRHLNRSRKASPRK